MRMFENVRIIDPAYSKESVPEHWGIAKFGGQQGQGSPAAAGLLGLIPSMLMGGGGGGGAPPTPGGPSAAGGGSPIMQMHPGLPGQTPATPNPFGNPGNILQMINGGAQTMNAAGPRPLGPQSPSMLPPQGAAGDIMARLQMLRQLDPTMGFGQVRQQ